MRNMNILGWWRKPQLLWSLVTIVFIVLAITAILWVPGFLVDLSSGKAADPELTTYQRVTATNFARQGVLFVVGGVIAIFTLLLTLAKHNLDRRGQELDREKQELDRDANWTSRYTEGIKLLGTDSSPSIRLGGIFALERIAQDSPRDRQPILDVLCAFIRDRSPAKAPEGPRDKMGIDIEAAITVFARQNLSTDSEIGADLSHTFLGGSNLSKANLAHTDFAFSNLSGAHLSEANLAHSILLNANLVRAEFSRANLRDVNLIRADLTLAGLNSADLSNAAIYEANLSMTHLSQAKLHKVGLTMAKMHSVVLIQADLTGATLSNADLTNARLNEAVLVDAEFSGAILKGANFTDSLMTGAVVRDASGEKTLVTYEYLASAEIVGIDSIRGLPRRSADKREAGAH